MFKTVSDKWGHLNGLGKTLMTGIGIVGAILATYVSYVNAGGPLLATQSYVIEQMAEARDYIDERVLASEDAVKKLEVRTLEVQLNQIDGEEGRLKSEYLSRTLELEDTSNMRTRELLSERLLQIEIDLNKTEALRKMTADELGRARRNSAAMP